jgi:hemerythrin-like domain-containing protein
LSHVKVAAGAAAYAGCAAVKAHQETQMNAMLVSPPARGRQPNGDGFDALDECHRQTLRALDTLAALVARLQQHGADDTARAMAAQVVRHFSTTARQHHEDEERHVFPRLLAGADAQVEHTIRRLQQDHCWLEEDWMELSAHLEALAAGHSWWDLAFLRDGAEVFSALSHDHIALEESCIYPEARARLQGAERREMGREMAARRRAQRAHRSG